jgi:hypothetical protein
MEKKLLVVLVVVGLCSTVALALDPMGPPAASLGKGKSSIGVEYSWSNMELERKVTKWGSGNGPGARQTQHINPMHKIYANLGYGMADNVDVFLRAGAGSAGYKPHGNEDWSSGDGEASFIFGGGIRGTLKEEPGVKWGFLAQYSCADDFRGNIEVNGDDATYDLKLDELQIAIGPTWTAAQGLTIYGGPFFHFVRGTVQDCKYGDILRHAMEEDSWLGGYVGVGLELAQNCSANVEWMQTPDDYALGAGLVFKQ